MQCLASSFYLAAGPGQERRILGNIRPSKARVRPRICENGHSGCLSPWNSSDSDDVLWGGVSCPGPFALAPLRWRVLSFPSKKRKVWKSVKSSVKTQILATFLWKCRYWLLYFQMETPCCETWKHVCFLILTLSSEITLLSVNFFFFLEIGF